jgi:uncharacterized C2H2 Zn-finger protein
MAQTIVILCDECLEGGAEVPGQTWGLMIAAPGSKGAPYEIDACEMHAEPFRSVLKALGEYGRRADRKTPMPRASTPGTPGTATAAATVAGSHVCPVCGYLSATDKAVKSHVRAAHGMAWAEATGKAHLPCPEPDCERLIGGGQGLSAHLRTGHGYSLERAREAVSTVTATAMAARE